MLSQRRRRWASIGLTLVPNFIILTVLSCLFRRLQEASFLHFRNPVSSTTGTQFCQLEETSFVSSVSSITGNKFRQFRFVSFVSSITGNQFRFISSVSFQKATNLYIKKRSRKPFGLSVRIYTNFHSLVLQIPPVWTLFLSGSHGVHNPWGG